MEHFCGLVQSGSLKEWVCAVVAVNWDEDTAEALLETGWLTCSDVVVESNVVEFSECFGEQLASINIHNAVKMIKSLFFMFGSP